LEAAGQMAFQSPNQQCLITDGKAGRNHTTNTASVLTAVSAGKPEPAGLGFLPLPVPEEKLIGDKLQRFLRVRSLFRHPSNSVEA